MRRTISEPLAARGDARVPYSPLHSLKVLALQLAVPALATLAAILPAAQRSAHESKPQSQGAVVAPVARLQTRPVPHRGDAADDPALWIHPTEPERSLILGTDKQGGLHVYKMDGTEHQLVSDRARPNNVDVLYGFQLGNRLVDLAVLVTQDDLDHRGRRVDQDFHLYPWEQIAGTRLLVDTGWSPRVESRRSSAPRRHPERKTAAQDGQ